MAGPDLPAYTLVQGSVISFIAGIFLGVYLISLAFANRWLIFTDDGWMFKKNIHWFTLILTNIIGILVSINQIFKVNVAIAEAKFVEQGHSPGEYVETLPWRPITEVSWYPTNSLDRCKLIYSDGWIVCRYHYYYLTRRYGSSKLFLKTASDSGE
jgi:hypothetical protein